MLVYVIKCARSLDLCIMFVYIQSVLYIKVLDRPIRLYACESILLAFSAFEARACRGPILECRIVLRDYIYGLGRRLTVPGRRLTTCRRRLMTCRRRLTTNARRRFFYSGACAVAEFGHGSVSCVVVGRSKAAKQARRCINVY